MAKEMDPASKRLRTYHTSVLNCAFDKLTRALWPSVTYWTLTDWMNENVATLDIRFHKARFEAMACELTYFTGLFRVVSFLCNEATDF